MKALYRRGQAYLGLQSWQLAKTDLQKAVQLAANDPVQLPLIQSKLALAMEHCKGESTQYRNGDVVIEDVTDEPSVSPAAAAPAVDVRPIQCFCFQNKINKRFLGYFYAVSMRFL